MTTIVCYISGHGLGHASRVIEVMNALASRRSDVRFAVRSPTPRWFLDTNLRAPFTHTDSRLDVGAVQRDSLLLDPEATLRAYAAISARREEIIVAETAALTHPQPSLVFADIPPIAFDIATRLDIPAVAMTNFSWDWIYADYVADFPEHAGIVDQIRRAYGRASLLLRLPLHGDLSAFPCIRDIPLVARRASRDRREVRRRLGVPTERRMVLLSFGGIGVNALPETPNAPASTCFFTVAMPSARMPPPWCNTVSTAALAQTGLQYEDLVAAADAVITKPGYGIVAECIANGTPIVYTPRGRFAEYQPLVVGIETYLTHAEIGNDDLRAGRWRTALDAVFTGRPPQRPLPDVDGASVAAEAILDLLPG